MAKLQKLLQEHIHGMPPDMGTAPEESKQAMAVSPRQSRPLTVPMGWCPSSFGMFMPGAYIGNAPADWVLAALACQIGLAGLPTVLLSLRAAATAEAADSR
jgi:hypothetical protein